VVVVETLYEDLAVFGVEGRQAELGEHGVDFGETESVVLEEETGDLLLEVELVQLIVFEGLLQL
jgi:hypothetical protein